MKRALLVSYYFPPRFSIGGKRAHRFAKYLPDHGWETVVLTAKAPDGERLDPTFSDTDLPCCEVHRELLSPAEIAQAAQRGLGSDGTIEAPTESWKAMKKLRGLAALRAELRASPIIGPDGGIIPLLANRIARRARESRVSLIFATGAPWEVVVAGAIAATMLRLPLVVEFRDPWSFGPLPARRPAWARAAMRLVERAVLRAASALVVTTETTRDAYAERGGCARLVCIRSGFDADIRVEPRPSDAVTFIHFGNCYGERSLAPYIRALAAVVHRRKLAPSAVRLLNLGRVTRLDLELSRELGVASFFEHSTVLPYAEGIGLVAGADLALLPSFGTEPWFLPGKLYDYLLAGAPMLAVDAHAELAQILASTRLGWSHAAEDIEGLARRMEDAIDARAQGRKLVTPDTDAIDALSARNAAGKLAVLLDEVAARGPMA
jgi:hypothetical protein